jgi:CoA:oxalate CoA-transferase
MTMPLEGITVLDWTQWQQGPVATMMLADLGAEVIKIEDRTVGDPSRNVEKLTGMLTFKTGRNAYFEMNNRGKKSITVDLRKDEGKEIIYKLVQKSDVFLHNFLDSVARRQKMDYETLSKYNPRLIYVHASGFGPFGPDADARSFDYIGLARSGIMSMCGEADMPPQRIEGGVGDQMGAVMNAYATVTALLARERLGVGQKVGASLLGSLIWLQGDNLAFKLIGGEEHKRSSRKAVHNPLWNHYECKDGKWLVLAHLQTDRYWPNVCKALGLQHIQNDPRFKDAGSRRDNSVALVAMFDGVFKSKTLDEWKTILAANEVIFTPLNDFDDVVNDPQILANGYVTDYEHPVWGKVRMPGVPIHLEKTPGKLTTPAPGLGQHTEEILLEKLGYTRDQVGELRNKDII